MRSPALTTTQEFGTQDPLDRYDPRWLIRLPFLGAVVWISIVVIVVAILTLAAGR